MDYATAYACVKKPDFKNVIKGIKPDDLGEDIVNVIQKEINNKETWNLANFKRVYQEVELIANWIEATIACGKISNSMEPMKNEIAALEAEQTKLKEELDHIYKEIGEIEENLHFICTIRQRKIRKTFRKSKL